MDATVDGGHRQLAGHLLRRVMVRHDILRNGSGAYLGARELEVPKASSSSSAFMGTWVHTRLREKGPSGD